MNTQVATDIILDEIRELRNRLLTIITKAEKEGIDSSIIDELYRAECSLCV